jgi:methionyl-tRNA formyltransferase
MKIGLIGSVSSSWYALDALIRAGVKVACVCCVDESREEAIGDYRSLRPLAERANIPYLSFVKVSEPSVAAFLQAHQPEMLWVIGLSQLVPNELIEIAPVGGVGFHPTMLPEGRGRAPVAWTILLGARAAANLFFLTDEADAGDIIVQKEVPVLPDDYSEDLIHRTNEVLADAIFEIAPQLKSGNVPRTPQDHSRATYYGRRTAEDGLIDWSKPTDQVYRLIRAAGRPYHGAFGFIGDTKVVVWRGSPVSGSTVGSGDENISPGTILECDGGNGVMVRAGDGMIQLEEYRLDASSAAAAEVARPGACFRW